MIIVDRGDSPLILCLPHAGSVIPPTVEARLSATGRMQADISWRLEQVLDVAREHGATIVRSTVSRYVIDVDCEVGDHGNSDASAATSLCPTVTLDQRIIYKPDEEPGPIEAEQRMLLFYNPFHQALEAEVARLRKQHDNVVVLDCQSIRSRIRGFIEQELAAVNIGTNGGQSCADGLRDAFAGSFAGINGFSVAIDGQFTGGKITRKFGQPDRGIHALTMVLAQRCYLRHESPPFEPDKARIARLEMVMIDGFSRVIDWVNAGRSGQDDPESQLYKPDDPLRRVLTVDMNVDCLGSTEVVNNDEFSRIILP